MGIRKATGGWMVRFGKNDFFCFTRAGAEATYAILWTMIFDLATEVQPEGSVV